MWDGCFSFPGLVVGLQRAERVTVAYFDQNGVESTLDTDWILSQLLQHEIDHLDSRLAVTRAISPQHLLTHEEWQRQGRPEFVPACWDTARAGWWRSPPPPGNRNSRSE